MTGERGTVLVTGATGYVGGRLVRALDRRGERVRCLARRPLNLRSQVPPDVEVVSGDVLEPATLAPALAGVRTAFYLVHSIGSDEAFEAHDREGARNFARAARAAGVRRIVYLGGLGERGDHLSPHLRSRHEVGDLLRESGVPVIEFRASIIIGSGSLSFEMVRSLAERLPVMVTPRWVSVAAQPIAIGDVLAYLIAAMDVEDAQNHVFEIGGADVVSYGDILREYARQRGLRRWMIPVPVLTPRLSSLWLALVTPLYARVGRKLIDSIEHATIVRDDAARRVFPIRPRSTRDAIADALANEDHEIAGTRWSDALSASGTARSWGGARFGSRLVDSRIAVTCARRGTAFGVIERIGGATGWYSGNALWTVRGWIDLLLGGVGMRRGRRHRARLEGGDVVDCWRVEAIEHGRRLRLSAEMKLPGRAWLEFEVEDAPGGAQIRQTAIFDPIGMAGLAYWYGIWPLHRLVFAGMLRGIARAADRSAASLSPPEGLARARARSSPSRICR
jgi:uncharacterized protein YbjT (DUF2867 family)